MRTPRATGAYAALVVLSLVWGYSWVVIKIATNDATPLIVAGVRIGVAALVLLAALALTHRSLRPTPVGPTVVLGLLQTTGFTLFQTIAVSIGGAGKTAILAYTMPFWVALLAWPFLGERITGTRWAALVLAAIGLAFVIAPLDTRSLPADAFALIAGVSWAASAVWAKRLRARYDVDLLALTTWQLVWGAVPLVVLMLVIPGHVRLTASFVAAMAFMAIPAGAMAWLLWLFILSRLPAGVAGIASLATPVVGVLAAALQLHEIPSMSERVGMACIVVALVVNAVPPRGGPERSLRPRAEPT